MPQRGVHHSRLIAALVALALVAACGRAGGESSPGDTTTPLVPTATVPATATAPSSSAPSATATVTVPSPSTPAPTAILTPTPVPSPSLTRPPDQQVELPDVDAHYDLEVTAFDPGTGHLEVVERVTLRSRSGPLPELHFTVTRPRRDTSSSTARRSTTSRSRRTYATTASRSRSRHLPEKRR